MMNYIEHQGDLDQKISKYYSLIYSTYFRKVIQNRLEDNLEFSRTLQVDQISTLKAIQVLIHDPVHVKYLLASLSEAIIRLMNMKKQEIEGVLNYVK